MDGCWCCDELQSPTSLDPSWAFVVSALAEPLQVSNSSVRLQAPDQQGVSLRARTTFRVVSTHVLRALGSDYELLDVHAHESGEHQVRGRVYDAEVHFVFRSPANLLLVVSVLVVIESESNQKSASAGSQSLLRALLDGALEFPPIEGPLYLLPGSLTSGNEFRPVQWVVLETATRASFRELAEFRERGLFQPVRALRPVGNRMMVYVQQ